MASDLLSVWAVWWCPSCAVEVAVYGEQAEVWCTACRCRLVDARDALEPAGKGQG